MQAEVRVEIAPGPLGLVFEPGSTVVHTVKPGSALSDCEPGDYIAAFRKPGAGDDSERLDCRSMTDVAFTELVTSFKDQPGRVVWLVRTNVYTVASSAEAARREAAERERRVQEAAARVRPNPAFGRLKS